VMEVSINAPQHPELSDPLERFIILADDVIKFAKMWQYSGLSNPGMNPHLRLALRLRDPFTPEYEEKRLQKSLQQRLLLPFGLVKDLKEVAITGDLKPYASIESELRRVQQEPQASPESCLRETLRLKAEGNIELQSGRFHEALALYNQAWEAMHVVIRGRRRHIHADAFFARELREAPFEGKNGQAERLILRVTLVANTCQVYLKLGEFEECVFWGMRSIHMLREAMGEDVHSDIPPENEVVLGFPAATQMGKTYFRTALAYKDLDDKAQARKLLKVAKLYLPADKVVDQEIAACALRLG